VDRFSERKRQNKRFHQRRLPPLSRAYRTPPTRSHRLALAVVIGALGLAVASPPTSAAFPGLNGRIAFASDGNGNIDIHTVNPDGSGNLDISDVSSLDLEPAWSPDGTRIAFRSGRANEGEIYTMNADGTGVTQMASMPRADGPARATLRLETLRVPRRQR
jgi:hypothetical protein